MGWRRAHLHCRNGKASSLVMSAHRCISKNCIISLDLLADIILVFNMVVHCDYLLHSTLVETRQSQSIHYNKLVSSKWDEKWLLSKPVSTWCSSYDEKNSTRAVLDTCVIDLLSSDYNAHIGYITNIQANKI